MRIITTLISALFLISSSVEAKPKKIHEFPLNPGVCDINKSVEKCVPYDDSNTCTPTCSQHKQWCTDCNGNDGGAPALDEDGFPLHALELEEEGFICSLSEEQGKLIGDCEIYGWVCERGRCVDSEGAVWPENLPLELNNPASTLGCSTITTHYDNGGSQCFIGCDNGFTADCTKGETIWWSCRYMDAMGNEGVVGGAGEGQNPCK